MQWIAGCFWTDLAFRIHICVLFSTAFYRVRYIIMSVVRVGTKSRLIDIDNLANKEGDNLEDTVQEHLHPAVGEVKLQGQDETLEEKEEELDLTGIDEVEIDSYIMSEAEIKAKTKLWLKVNAEYLEEQALKMKREEEKMKMKMKREREKRENMIR